MNIWIGMGRLTAEPELRRTQSGTACCNFTLAVQRETPEANGEYAADFIDCVAWKGTAEFVSKYFHKGQRAAVKGPLRKRRWTDKDGIVRWNVECVALDVYFADSKKEEAKQTVDFSKIPLVDEYEELRGDDGDLPF